jgi:hypothetical protein
VPSSPRQVGPAGPEQRHDNPPTVGGGERTRGNIYHDGQLYRWDDEQQSWQSVARDDGTGAQTPRHEGSTAAGDDKAAAGAKGAEKGADTGEPSGSGGKLPWTSWQNYPKTTVNGREYAVIGDRLYPQHAVDRMQPSGLGAPAGTVGPGRSVPPTYADDAIRNTEGTPAKPGPDGAPRLKHVYGDLTVITEDNDRIVLSVISR